MFRIASEIAGELLSVLILTLYQMLILLMLSQLLPLTALSVQ